MSYIRAIAPDARVSFRDRSRQLGSGLRDRCSYPQPQTTSTRGCQVTAPKEKRKPLNREEVKMLWMSLGAAETARQLNLKPNTVTKWASRYGWNKYRLVPVSRTTR